MTLGQRVLVPDHDSGRQGVVAYAPALKTCRARARTSRPGFASAARTHRAAD